MKITVKAWKAYKNKMARISRTAADKMQAFVDKYGLEDRKALLDYAASLVGHYGQASGSLACDMYEATAEAQGITVPAAEMAELPGYGEIAKNVNGAIKESEKMASGAVGRMVKKVGADTTLKNAERDGGEFAWIPSGDTCAYCLALAAKGWHHVSENTAGNGYAEHIHANCDCQYAVRLDKKSTVEGYDPDQYSKMFANAEGETEKEKINSLRGALRANKKLLKRKLSENLDD